MSARLLRTAPEGHLPAIRVLWDLGHDTAQIAAKLRLREYEVHNSLPRALALVNAAHPGVTG